MINRFYHLNNKEYPQIIFETDIAKFDLNIRIHKKLDTSIKHLNTSVYLNRNNTGFNIRSFIMGYLTTKIPLANRLFFNSNLIKTKCNKEGFLDILDFVFCVYITQSMVYILDFPDYIEIDNDGFLHNELDSAIKFGNSELAAFHGQHIPINWVKGKFPEPKKLLSWPNLDQRAAGCAMYGWHNLRSVCKSKTIDKDPDPVWGELVDMELANRIRERFLFVECGTGRQFALPVPNTVQTVDEAQEILHGGIPAYILKNSVQRT